MAGQSSGGNIRDKVENAASQATHTAKETASSLGQKASETASHLGQRAQEMASTAKERAQDLASRASERTGEAVSSVGQGMGSLAGTIRQNAPSEGMLGTAAGAVAGGLETGAQYLQENDLGAMTEDVAGLVRRYPIPSLLVVFGIGYLAGSILRR